MDDIFVGLGMTLLVGDIPAQRFEQWVEKFSTHLGFVVALALVGLAILVEPVDEGGNDERRLAHREGFTLCDG